MHTTRRFICCYCFGSFSEQTLQVYIVPKPMLWPTVSNLLNSSTVFVRFLELNKRVSLSGLTTQQPNNLLKIQSIVLLLDTLMSDNYVFVIHFKKRTGIHLMFLELIILQICLQNLLEQLSYRSLLMLSLTFQVKGRAEILTWLINYFTSMQPRVRVSKMMWCRRYKCYHQ